MRALVGVVLAVGMVGCGGDYTEVEHTCWGSQGGIKVVEEIEDDVGGFYYWTAADLPKNIEERSVELWGRFENDDYWGVSIPDRDSKGQPLGFCQQELEVEYKLVIH